MTTTPAATSEMDHLDQLVAKAFDGFLDCLGRLQDTRFQRRHRCPQAVA